MSRRHGANRWSPWRMNVIDNPSMEGNTTMASTRKTRGIVALTVLTLLICGCGKKDQGQTPGSNSTETSPSAAAVQDQSMASTPGQTSTPMAGTPSGSSTPMASTPSGSSTAMPDMADAAAQTQQTLTQMNQGQTVEALSPAVIKEYLPAELSGFTRTDASAERNQMGGVDIAVASGEYEGANGASLSVQVTDAGNLSGPMKMALTSWAMNQYSRETDTGYEKVTTYDGYKAMEQYDNETKDGTLRVFVANRFVVEVDGSQVTMDTIKQAMGQIDLKKLAGAK